ncbi:hypothetical protein TEA_010876 [Camellia sinensis var. sinensis]|uniref:Uncharacterized protein n=1 Tax=Camellia sinensis var. sinensis TaxID=542762 RepID=A0A4S4CZV4_CAMSN|nr:hypothetical protein TEA_010876 [Camellia sinensis var. sinensis]
MVKRDRGLTDEERRALRGSKFAPLPPFVSSPSRSKPKPRLPHPDGPLTTNKAAALAKFLERKLQEPNGLASIKPKLVELAIKNAKATVNASGASHSGRIVRQVDSLGDFEDSLEDGGEKIESKKHKKEKKKKKDKGKKQKKQKSSKDTADVVVKRPKKKLKL